jgi:hypothetical protein
MVRRPNLAKEEGLVVQVLGSGGPMPYGSRASTGYLQVLLRIPTKRFKIG